MSYLVEREFPCNYCQFPTTAEVWSVINVREDPELKDLLLGGEINMVECRSCRKIFYAEQFLVYHDPVNEHMAFVYPHAYSNEKEKWIQKAQADFKESQANLAEEDRLKYEPQAYFGMDELLEAIKWEEESQIQSDIARHLAVREGIPFKELPRRQSRNQKMPIVLPYVMKSSEDAFEEAVLEGLRQIHQLNNNLFVYRDAHELIQKGLKIT